MNVAPGWRFYSADFSCNAADPQALKKGSVILKRDPQQTEAWHKLSEQRQDEVELFVFGHGVDFHTALEDANAVAMSHPHIVVPEPTWTYSDLKGKSYLKGKYND